MFTITRSFEGMILEPERSYLQDNDLRELEQYAHSFTDRLKAYELVRDYADEIVLDALKRLAADYPEQARANKQDKCQYDMTIVLRYMALSMLREDEHFFRDKMIDWLGTVITSSHVRAECADGYTKLYKVISSRLPANRAVMFKPYIDIAIATFKGSLQ
ncbi:Phycocyanin [Thalassoporum mexicanum PCC 7367]|uniref:phycocyanin n=1 Tax=Thalassoporum mexicanum TaxID=3457544 RepID=UPI00029FE40C|nr:phycocyanin [Pseudanabaena sp. PCC 7367]AFY70256.1 Phycocyanin [Pseudanabaena sp. PCC 7367]